MLLFITWSVVLIGLSLVNFRRAKVMTSVFIGVLFLQRFLQVAFVWFYRSEQVAFVWFDRRELVNTCSAAILLTFVPNLGVFVFAAAGKIKSLFRLDNARFAGYCNTETCRKECRK